MSKSTKVNKNEFTPFANCGCQSLPVNKNELTPFANGGWQSLPRSKKNEFTAFANGGCQSLPKSTRMSSHPLLMVDVKVYQSTRMSWHPLLMVDGKVYQSHQECIDTSAKSTCIYQFNEWIPENERWLII